MECARPVGSDGPVAQLDRALPSEGKGRTFESSRVRQSSQLVKRVVGMRTVYSPRQCRL
jgi:hypothetical protein